MKMALPFVESVDALNCLLKGTTEALGRCATIEYSQDAAPHAGEYLYARHGTGRGRNESGD